jgi:hypothetical protein
MGDGFGQRNKPCLPAGRNYKAIPTIGKYWPWDEAHQIKNFYCLISNWKITRTKSRININIESLFCIRFNFTRSGTVDLLILLLLK